MLETENTIDAAGDIREPSLERERGVPASGLTLLELAADLARARALVAKVAGIAIAIGLILCFALPVRYQATVKIMPPEQTPSTASLLMSQLAASAGPVAALAGSGLGLKNPDDLYVGLLGSRVVTDGIIRRFGLMQVYRSKDMTAARKKLAGYTSIEAEKSGLIAITVTDRDPHRVAAMANAFPGQLRELTQSVAASEASERRLFYEGQLNQARDSLLAAELAFQQVQLSKGMVSLDAQARAMVDSLSMARAQVAAKQVELEALRSYSTDRNPGVQLAGRELAALEAQAAQLEQKSRSPQFAKIGLEDVPGASMEYLRAQHEVQYRQQLYDLLFKQYDAARLDEAKQAAVIQVVEPAVEPDRRSSPKRAAILVLSALIGLFAAYLAVRLRCWLEAAQADPERARALRNLKSALAEKSSSRRGRRV